MQRIAAFGFGLLLLGVLGLFLPPAQSASFDCAKAAHPLEKAICASPKLSKLDEDVAALYKAKLATLFDKQSLRNIQRGWQQQLRAACAETCDPATVEAEYTRQHALLRELQSDTYEASYKTADVATLTITHLPNQQFDFTITRDRDDESLCKLPANDAEAGAVTSLSTPTTARWSSGACTLDLALTRDPAGHVSRIDVSATPGCKRYCTQNFNLGDMYLPAGG